MSSMNFSRCVHSSCVVNGKIYVVGGLNTLNGEVKDTECYDPKLDTWTSVGKTDIGLYSHSVVAL